MGRLSVVAISGSPSGTSKTAMIADQALRMVQALNGDVDVTHFRVRDINPVALLSGNMADADLARLGMLLEEAHGVIIATPIFKASYSGLLKAALDVLPQFGLAGKVVLPIGTGGSLAHVLALDYGLRPVLQSMGARHIVQSHFAWEQDLVQVGDQYMLSPGGAEPLGHAIGNFLHSLSDAEDARWLGHPRPAFAM